MNLIELLARSSIDTAIGKDLDNLGLLLGVTRWNEENCLKSDASLRKELQDKIKENSLDDLGDLP